MKPVIIAKIIPFRTPIKNSLTTILFILLLFIVIIHKFYIKKLYYILLGMIGYYLDAFIIYLCVWKIFYLRFMI